MHSLAVAGCLTPCLPAGVRCARKGIRARMHAAAWGTQGCFLCGINRVRQKGGLDWEAVTIATLDTTLAPRALVCLCVYVSECADGPAGRRGQLVLCCSKGVGRSLLFAHYAPLRVLNYLSARAVHFLSRSFTEGRIKDVPSDSNWNGR